VDVNGEPIRIPYKEGEKCGVDFENYVYALKDLILDSYRRIRTLEEEIRSLKQN